MADFRIGDRVRIVAPLEISQLHGRTATIYDIQRPVTLGDRLFGGKPWQWAPHAIQNGVHPKEIAYLLRLDGGDQMLDFFPLFGVIGMPYYWLRPLSDPKADEFIERIKKLKPYDEPVAPRITFSPDVEREIREFLNGE